MKQLDERLDKNPVKRDIMDMVELRIRNLQAFDELQSFNDTGKFLYIHPLITHQSERAQLTKLLKTDPLEFLRLHKDVATTPQIRILPEASRPADSAHSG